MPKKEYSAPPPMTIDPNKQYSATLKTSRGEIVCDLFAKDAPKTVNNFVFLAKEKFYDGTVFHRVIADFMVQGGDPTATQVKLLYVVLTGRTGTFRIIGTIRAKRKSGARIL